MIDMIINYNILFMIDIRLIFDVCASTCDYDSRYDFVGNSYDNFCV